MGNRRGFIRTKAVAPPGRLTFLATVSPIGVSPEGIFSEQDAGPGAGRFLKWEELESVVADARWVKINGRRWLKTPSVHNAEEIARELKALKNVPAADRDRLLRRWIGTAFRMRDIEKALAGLRAPLRRMAILSNSLFVILFLGLLPASFFFSFRDLWIGIAVVGLAHTITIGETYRRAHRRLYPTADDERFSAWLTMLLFAPAAIRAHDGITQPALYRFHPLAVSVAVLKKDRARAHVATFLRERRFPPPGRGSETDAPLRAAKEWHRARMIECMEECCESAGWRVDELLGPPIRLDPASRAFCPRCLAEFVIEKGGCPDCGGLALSPFPESEG